MNNFKKFVIMAVLGAMMTFPLAGCGGSDTDTATDEVETNDVVTEESTSTEGVSDETFNALQSQYSGLVEVYNIIKDAHESGVVELSDEQVETFNEAADLINEIGELSKDNFESEDDAVSVSEVIAGLAEGLAAIYDEASASGAIDLSSEGITDESFAAVQQSYSALCDLYNTVKAGVEAGAITLTSEQTDSINQVADLINQMGEIEKSNFTSEQDAIDLLSSMSKLADILGSTVE